MADRISRERRSWNMRQVRSSDTRPEVLVRSILHRMGLRFRNHVRCLPGSPDIVLPKWKTAVFVHGCFWHRHQGCRYCYDPKTRKAFWRNKFRENVVRDARNTAALEELGWRVETIWECELRNQSGLSRKLRQVFR